MNPRLPRLIHVPMSVAFALLIAACNDIGDSSAVPCDNSGVDGTSLSNLAPQPEGGDAAALNRDGMVDAPGSDGLAEGSAGDAAGEGGAEIDSEVDGAVSVGDNGSSGSGSGSGSSSGSDNSGSSSSGSGSSGSSSGSDNGGSSSSGSGGSSGGGSSSSSSSGGSTSSGSSSGSGGSSSSSSGSGEMDAGADQEVDATVDASGDASADATVDASQDTGVDATSNDASKDSGGECVQAQCDAVLKTIVVAGSYKPTNTTCSKTELLVFQKHPSSGDAGQPGDCLTCAFDNGVLDLNGVTSNAECEDLAMTGDGGTSAGIQECLNTLACDLGLGSDGTDSCSDPLYSSMANPMNTLLLNAFCGAGVQTGACNTGPMGACVSQWAAGFEGLSDSVIQTQNTNPAYPSGMGNNVAAGLLNNCASTCLP